MNPRTRTWLKLIGKKREILEEHIAKLQNNDELLQKCEIRPCALIRCINGVP